jgi:hypothetical protein
MGVKLGLLTLRKEHKLKIIRNVIKYIPSIIAFGRMTRTQFPAGVNFSIFFISSRPAP